MCDKELKMYIALFVNDDANRYQNISKTLNDVINEQSFENISKIELLVKVLSLKHDIKQYDKKDYVNTQLKKLIKSEKNELFLSVFNLVKHHSSANSEVSMDMINKLFYDYEQELKKHYESLFELFYEFVHCVCVNKKKVVKTDSKTSYNSLENYSHLALKNLLDFYTFEVQTHGLMNAYELVQKEIPLIRTLISDYLFCSSHNLEEIQKLLGLEYKVLMKDMETKLEITKWGLLLYLKSICNIKLEYSRFYLERNLEILFEPEIQYFVFEYVKRKLHEV